ncbi:MAG: EamA family transporter [Myxococcota bacterium]|nr:EamA family transporter [Myxococcota bacterium]
MNLREGKAKGGAYGLAAAALFGLSAPTAKLLLPHASPLVLSSLLYLGAGFGLLLYQAIRREPKVPEARLERGDLPLLLGISLLGGGVAPVLMLTGLERVSGISGSLLLNLEAPLTMLIAVSFLGEHLTRREVMASVLIVAAAAVLGYRSGDLGVSWTGVAAIAGACLCWAVDNNLSQRLSGKDPVAIVQVKGLTAGTGTLLLALATRQVMPGPELVGAALALGAVSYGLSLLFDMRALRLLGAAREAAFFATAPFIGAALAIPLLGERPRLADVVVAAGMVAGVGLLVRARHGHLHTHPELGHDHLHVHDEHHRHAHREPADGPHSHFHQHVRLTHDHPHVSDQHHRHPHR